MTKQTPKPKPKRDQQASQAAFRTLIENVDVDDEDAAAIQQRIADTEALPDTDDDEIVEVEQAADR